MLLKLVCPVLCSLKVVGVRAWDPVERNMGSYGEEHELIIMVSWE
jgi:hypothetical protein